MMRLVFLLCAEERGLLLLGDPFTTNIMQFQLYEVNWLKMRTDTDQKCWKGDMMRGQDS